MKALYTIHNLPPNGHLEDYYSDRLYCDALINSYGRPLDHPENYWHRCRHTPIANGYCFIHQYLAERKFIMEGFYMVVTESGHQATCKYSSLEEAQAIAEKLARQSGEDVYILKPFKKASVHRVDWEEVEDDH